MCNCTVNPFDRPKWCQCEQTWNRWQNTIVASGVIRPSNTTNGSAAPLCPCCVVCVSSSAAGSELCVKYLRNVSSALRHNATWAGLCVTAQRTLALLQIDRGGGNEQRLLDKQRNRSVLYSSIACHLKHTRRGYNAYSSTFKERLFCWIPDAVKMAKCWKALSLLLPHAP